MSGIPSDTAREAKVLAESAHKRIDRHEDQCGKYYRELRQEMHEMRVDISAKLTQVYSKMDGIKDRSADWWKAVMVGVIVALMGALGYLLTQGRPWI